MIKRACLISCKDRNNARIFVWMLPGMLFQALVHIEDPGHTLFSVPAMCIIAAYLIYAGAQRFESLREVLLAGALVVNTLLFLGFFALPAAGEPTGGLRSLRNAFLFGTFETSIGELRYQDDTAKRTMAELRQFTNPERPSIIVSSDADVVNWFMNWRIMRYYAPATDIWVIADLRTPHLIQHVRRDQTLETRVGSDLSALRCFSIDCHSSEVPTF